jgi:hypothetical protein
MLFKKITVVYHQTDMKSTNTLRLHNTELLTVKAAGTYSYQWARDNFLFVNSFIYNIIVKSCRVCVAHYNFNGPSDKFFDHLITFLLALLRQKKYGIYICRD